MLVLYHTFCLGFLVKSQHLCECVISRTQYPPSSVFFPCSLFNVRPEKSSYTITAHLLVAFLLPLQSFPKSFPDPRSPEFFYFLPTPTLLESTLKHKREMKALLESRDTTIVCKGAFQSYHHHSNFPSLEDVSHAFHPTSIILLSIQSLFSRGKMESVKVTFF